MDINHKVQRKIIQNLIHNPSLSFTELWDKEIDSNKFAYHLAALESKNIVKKDGNGRYTLSEEGKKHSVFIEGDTGEKAIVPVFANALIVQTKDKILVQRRMKEPFFGYWALISGKINQGFNIEECAVRDLAEETGLNAGSSKFIGINQIKTYEKGKLLYHHIIFLVSLSDVSGNLKERTHKAENVWMTIDEFETKERLPDPWLRELLSTKGMIFLETERTMVNGKFTDCKTISQRSISDSLTPLLTKALSAQ